MKSLVRCCCWSWRPSSLPAAPPARRSLPITTAVQTLRRIEASASPATGHGPGRLRIADHADSEGSRAAGNGIARLHVRGNRRRLADQLQCQTGAAHRSQSDAGDDLRLLRLPALRRLGGYGYDTRVDQYVEGTINIDMVDAQRKQLVWEGVAVGRVTKKTQEDRQAALRGAVTEIFAKYPFRAGG